MRVLVVAFSPLLAVGVLVAALPLFLTGRVLVVVFLPLQLLVAAASMLLAVADDGSEGVGRKRSV